MSHSQEDAVLNELKQLQIHVDNHRVLALLPLVFVAWADGRVQKAESELILKIAHEHAFCDAGGEGLLRTWLDEPPTQEYYAQGFRVLKELARRERNVGATLNAETLQELIGLSFDVAKAAGGLFGTFWTVSPEEEVALAQIATALSIDDGRAWFELETELEKS